MKKAKTLIPRPGLPIILHYREDDALDLAVMKEMFSLNVYRFNGNQLQGSNPVVLDIGANIGTFTLQVLSVAQEQQRPVTIYAVEPEKDNLELLKENLAANPRLFHNGSEVVIIEAGVSDFMGKAKITNNSGSSRISEDGTQEIDIVTYDHLLEKIEADKIDFVKIDIEGSEIPLTAGASKDSLLKAHHYAIEWDTENNKEDFLTMLSRFTDDFSLSTWGVPSDGCNLYLENHSWSKK